VAGRENKILAKQSPPSLDLQGTQAAIYPDENVLWVTGPPINDPGDQGVEYTGSDGAGTPLDGPPPVPRSSADIQNTEDILHEQLNGETPNGAYGEAWVNTGIIGPTGIGPYNDETKYESGHTQIIQSNPSAEQGWGVGPARRWAHYPIEQNVNPFRNRMVHCRNGELPWVYADTQLYYRTQLEVEQQWDPYKQRSPVSPIVGVPASVPFSTVVPTFGGGNVQYPGIDVPYSNGPVGDEGGF
jgi:hypothetical protein